MPPHRDVADTPAPAVRWRARARSAYVVGLVLAAGAVLFVQRDRVADLAEGARPLPLAAALALGLASLLQSAWFWSTALRRLGAPTPTGRHARSHRRRHPGPVRARQRLVLGGARSPTCAGPGIAHGRAQRRRRARDPAVVRRGRRARARAWWRHGRRRRRSPQSSTLVGVAAAIGVVGSPSVLNRALRWVGARRGLADVPALRWRTYLELSASSVLFWLASAGAFVLYLAAFPMVDAPAAADTAGTFLLAWAAGFLAVFAPQGAGVFETAVAGTLDGAPLAALAVVVGGYRAVTALRDVVALVALALLRLADRSTARAHERLWAAHLALTRELNGPESVFGGVS